MMGWNWGTRVAASGLWLPINMSSVRAAKASICPASTAMLLPMSRIRSYTVVFISPVAKQATSFMTLSKWLRQVVHTVEPAVHRPMHR